MFCSKRARREKKKTCSKSATKLINHVNDSFLVKYTANGTLRERIYCIFIMIFLSFLLFSMRSVLGEIALPDMLCARY